ncbi:hypothetical protein [Paenarthrobacter nitroguajacolicus]|nr:hypothetical protein [Paenarthrobacter nitroguajacolicus]
MDTAEPDGADVSPVAGTGAAHPARRSPAKATLADTVYREVITD